jgi:DNA-binding XRE family transcriptional regulator
MKNCIKEELVRQELTQGQLAKRVGIKREYLNRIINNKVTPTVPLGIKISRHLGLIVEDVFFLMGTHEK